MKCPDCNGSGVSDDRLICYRCGGIGEVKENNFDRITASPEALAEFLGEYAMPPCGHIVLCKECPLNGKSCLDDNVATDKDAWLIWLKQESKE